MPVETVYRFEKGLGALDKMAKNGGWEDGNQYLRDAQLDRDEAEDMYWNVIPQEDTLPQVDITGMPEVEISSMTNVATRFYDVRTTGFQGPDGAVYVTPEVFEHSFL